MHYIFELQIIVAENQESYLLHCLTYYIFWTRLSGPVFNNLLKKLSNGFEETHLMIYRKVLTNWFKESVKLPVISWSGLILISSNFNKIYIYFASVHRHFCKVDFTADIHPCLLVMPTGDAGDSGEVRAVLALRGTGGQAGADSRQDGVQGRKDGRGCWHCCGYHCHEACCLRCQDWHRCHLGCCQHWQVSCKLVLFVGSFGTEWKSVLLVLLMSLEEEIMQNCILAVFWRIRVFVRNFDQVHMPGVVCTSCWVCSAFSVLSKIFNFFLLIYIEWKM